MRDNTVGTASEDRMVSHTDIWAQLRGCDSWEWWSSAHLSDTELGVQREGL